MPICRVPRAGGLPGGLPVAAAFRRDAVGQPKSRRTIKGIAGVYDHIMGVFGWDDQRLARSRRSHAAGLQEYAELGVDAVYLFNVNRNQREFIESFGERVLPELERTQAATR